MLSFSGSLKVFIAVAPCDMRKGLNGLYAAVTERLGEDPKSGALCQRALKTGQGWADENQPL